jgi:hypothetical protein
VQAIFFKIAAVLIWICSSRLAHRFNSWGNYYCSRALFPLIAFTQYGRQVIDFAVNTSKRIKELDETYKIDALEKMYGHKAIASWSKIGTQEIALQREKLAPREMMKEGCCLGMSFDFIDHYLQEITAGKTPIDAVKAVAPRYAEGAPDEAVLGQIFYSALDISRAREKQWTLLKSTVGKNLRHAKKALQESEARLRTFVGKKNFADEFAKHKKKSQQIEKDVETYNLNALVLSHGTGQEQCTRIVAEKMGLILKKSAVYTINESKTQTMSGDFQQLVDQLPEGAYQIGLFSNKSSAGHSIAFIKTASQCFIHEPNFATLQSSRVEAAKMLWKVSKDSYLKEGLCVMHFNCMTRL